MRSMLIAIAAAVGILSAQAAVAQIPVYDAQSVANQVQQVAAWGTQYTQMKNQYDNLVVQLQQLQQTYGSLNGVRGMADVANHPELRKYLPSEWQGTMDAMTVNGANYPSLSGSFQSILAAMGPANTNLTGESATAYTTNRNLAAMNRAIGEEGYRQASQRFDSIQQLLERMRTAPDAKDMADLSARIQVEQTMVQNEQVKLQLVGQLQQAQRELQAQQMNELQLRGLKRRPIEQF